MEPKPTSMKMALNIWIENPEGEILFGDGRLQILQAIVTFTVLSTLAISDTPYKCEHYNLSTNVRHLFRTL